MTSHAQPPAPKKLPTRRTIHGVELLDDYAWMHARDDEEVLEHLRAENAYTEAMTAHTAQLREELFAEIRGRVQETDTSAPVPFDGWEYYTRTVEDLQYAIHCRRRGSDGDEQILLDENELAEGHGYFSLGVYETSPDHRFLAYATDTTGDERYTLVIKDLTTGELLADRIPDVGYGLAWANDDATLFYTVLHPTTWRPYKVMRHRRGEDPAADVCVWEEPDERFSLGAYRSQSRRYVLVHAGANTTSEVRAIPADEPGSEPRVIRPRREGVEYTVDHHRDRFVITTNDGAVNFRVMVAPDDRPDAWTELIAGRDEVKVEYATAFTDHLVLGEREAGLTHVRVIGLDDGTDHRVEMPEPVYLVAQAQNTPVDLRVLRLSYTSLTTPVSAFDYDIATRELTLVKEQPVLGGFDRADYVTERIWATSPDGTQVPISLVRHVSTPVDGTAPGLLYGYGSYGISIDPTFSSQRLSLLDRGMVFAIAHIRGGGELGEPWRDGGKLRVKQRTFDDFVACAEEVLDRGIVARDRLAIMGGSAGGLLVGAVVNMRPELFRCVVSQVPFVDVVNTMLDPSLPLTVGEYDEWGNPEHEEFFHIIRAYSPYDNVGPRAFPDMLVTSGINDPRVQFWEPAKWVAKIREHTTADNPVLLKMELVQGHGGPSGRYDAMKEAAFIYAFVLDRLGVVSAPD